MAALSLGPSSPSIFLPMWHKPCTQVAAITRTSTEGRVNQRELGSHNTLLLELAFLQMLLGKKVMSQIANKI
jgi:hypothetical protein